MLNSLFIRCSQFLVYWKLLYFLRVIKFWVSSRIIFKLKTKTNDTLENFSIFAHLLKITSGGFLFAILVIYILIFIDPLLKPVYIYLGISVSGGEEYISFFSTVSSICGLFIGLYYAAITTVSASVYSQVPNNIRILLQKEKIGNIYMRLLAFITFLSLLLIVLRLLYIIFLPSAVILMIVLAGIGVISFIKLGQGAFYLFDPLSLSATIILEINKYVQNVGIKGYKWNDKNFQSFAHNQVVYNIETIETLSSIVIKSPHLNGRPYVEFTKNILNFLMLYQSQKQMITKNSLWFEVVYVYKNWYKTNDTALGIAHAKATQLQPDQGLDYFWIEKRLNLIIYDSVRINILSNNPKVLSIILDRIQEYLNTYARNGELEKAFEFISKLELSVEHSIKEIIKSKGKNDILLALFMYESLLSMLISLVLEFGKTFNIYSREEISHRLSKIKWQNKKSAYNNGFPSFCSEQIQKMSEMISLEMHVEDRVVTPNWYLAEILSHQITNKIVDTIDFILSKFYELIQRWKDKYSKSEILITSAILSREWELYNETFNSFVVFECQCNQTYIDRKIDSLGWSNINDISIHSRLKQWKDKILIDFAKNNLSLFPSKEKEGYPDYHGQFLHTISECIIDAICDNNDKLFSELYFSCFNGCLSKFEELKPYDIKAKWKINTCFQIAVAPLIDLFEISGYALLMSEFYYNEKFKVIIKATWDNFLKNDAEEKLSLISTAIQLVDNSIAIPLRGVLRIQWKQKIEIVLKKLPRKYTAQRHNYWTNPDIIIEHVSPLVRVMAKDDHDFYDGVDIFSHLYLSNHENGSNKDFSNNLRNLISAIEDEKEIN